ncbi:hypothetical protein IVG45_07240 [Methylomonas sp. LL1]|uniref:type II secretion system protein N n=1 Tax=Methylomonas sp. LL1 TaxID=2785785 RepID=UPI0018C3EE9E|nr:type II secretion system protein N [Methylomonas sp. LL1]QPK64736.1 hypothetical protein IVG45_07240 [Methylomonas sp. LL1]
MMRFKYFPRRFFNHQSLSIPALLAKRLPFHAGLLASVYLSYTLFSLTLAVQPDDKAGEDGASRPEPRATAMAPAPDYLQISDWHLFGQPAAVEEADQTVSASQLQLKLLGVFLLSKSPETASAIIQTEDGAQKKYSPGDELPGGATLQTVEQTRVVLLYNSRRESLALEKNNAVLLANTE